MEDLVKLKKALDILKSALPEVGQALDKIAALYGVKADDAGKYNGEFPEGFEGHPVTASDYIAKSEDNIRKFGIGISRFSGDSNIENLYNARRIRYLQSIKDNEKSDELIAEYDRLNPYPLSSGNKEVDMPYTLPHFGDKLFYNPGDYASTAIPREILP